MINWEQTITEGSNIRKFDVPMISQWIVDPWNELPIKSVVNEFKKCYINNMLDGTEDGRRTPPPMLTKRMSWIFIVTVQHNWSGMP